MIKTWGQIWKNGKMIASDTYESMQTNMSDALQESIEYYGHLFDMEAPMWHSAHTKQLRDFQKIVFSQADFIDQISFDRFELHLIEQD